MASLLLVSCDSTETGDASQTSGAGSGTTGSDAAATAAASTGSPVVDYGADVQPLWNARCTCHLQGPSGTMQATTLTLNPERSYDELVGVMAVGAPTLVRVEPDELEASYLWHKLRGTHALVGGGGDAMPPGTMLDPSELSVIERWIEQGAPP